MHSTTVLSAALSVFALSTLLHAGPAQAESDPPSTATVVVGSTFVVGTSSITIPRGTFVGQFLPTLEASDGSSQTRAVVKRNWTPRATGAIAADDRLLVTAEDGSSKRSYEFDFTDPQATERDGEYWNQELYDQIDSTVNAHEPTFPNRICDITAAPFSQHVRQATERYATGNQAGNPANKTSPLVYVSEQITYHGDAINAAIQACHEAGGGIVVVPPGTYRSGAIHLLSNVNLRVETGATVKFVRTKSNEFYPLVRTSYEGTDLYSFSPLIYAYHQHDIAVTGGGTLDGQEDMWNWRPWKKGYWGEPSVEDQATSASYGQQGVLNRMNFEDVPIEQRIFTDDGSMPSTIPVLNNGEVQQIAPPSGTTALKSTFRPSFIQPYDSTDILIQGVKIRNPPFWQVHPVSSTNVIIRGLDIYSDKTKDFESSGWNNDDGIDPESSQNVVVENNQVTVSDDGMAIKAGRNVNGRLHRDPSQNIIVRNSSFRNDGGNSAAVSMGSEMSGGIRNVFAHDLTFGGPGLVMGLKLKTNANRGGAIENIYVRDSVLEQAKWGLIQLDSNYSETVSLPNADVYDPTIREVYLDQVDTAPTIADGRNVFTSLSAASRSPLSNVFYRDSTFHTTARLDKGLSGTKYFRNLVVDDVRFTNPTTGAVTTYNTKPIGLVEPTQAVLESGDSVALTPNSLTRIAGRTLRLRGKVDLAGHPTLLTQGTVRLLVDRDSTPVTLTVQPDGSFLSAPIVLDDTQYWYRDRHYLSVNTYQGIDINTTVYQVQGS